MDTINKEKRLTEEEKLVLRKLILERLKNYDKKECVFLDIETSGLNLDDEIIQLQCVKKKNDNIMEVYNSFYASTKPLSKEIEAITGIKQLDICDKKTYKEEKDKIIQFVSGRKVVCINAEFIKQYLQINNLDFFDILPIFKSVLQENNLPTKYYRQLIGGYNGKPLLDAIPLFYFLNN